MKLLSPRLVLAVLCLWVCLSVCEGQRSLFQSPSANTSTGGLAAAEVGRFFASARSCASASATSTGPGTVTVTATSNSAVAQNSARACGSAAADASAEVCKGGDAVAAASAFAEACAESVVKLILNTTVNAASSTAFARGCGTACSQAQATANAVAQALATGAADGAGRCATVSSTAVVSAAARIISNLTASAWSYACVNGRGTAASIAALTVTQVANAYANAFGSVLATACGSCSTCRCSKSPGVIAAANSDLFSEASDGKFATATAVSDAAAQVCRVKANGQNVTAAINAATASALSVYADNCVAIFGQAILGANSTGAGAASACVTINSNTTVASEATANILGEAFSMAFKGKCASAVNLIVSEASVRNVFNVMERAYTNFCAGRTPRGSPLTVELKNVITNNQAIATVMNEAFSNVVNECGCEGSPWCCTGCNWGVTCPGYAT